MWNTIADAINSGYYNVIDPTWREKYCREDKECAWIADGIVRVTLAAASRDLPKFVIETKVHATYDRLVHDFTVESGFRDLNEYAYDIIVPGHIIKNFSTPTEKELNDIISGAAEIVNNWAMGEFYAFCAGTKITVVLRRFSDSGLGKSPKLDQVSLYKLRKQVDTP